MSFIHRTIRLTIRLMIRLTTHLTIKLSSRVLSIGALTGCLVPSCREAFFLEASVIDAGCVEMKFDAHLRIAGRVNGENASRIRLSTGIDIARSVYTLSGLSARNGSTWRGRPIAAGGWRATY